MLGGLGAGLLDFSLSVVIVLSFDEVPGALDAGLGAATGCAGLGTALEVGFVVEFSELTLPLLAGLIEPSPLSVRGAGLSEVNVRESSVLLLLFGCASMTAALTTVEIVVAAEAINGLGSLTLERTDGPTHCNESG